MVSGAVHRLSIACGSSWHTRNKCGRPACPVQQDYGLQGLLIKIELHCFNIADSSASMDGNNHRQRKIYHTTLPLMPTTPLPRTAAITSKFPVTPLQGLLPFGQNRDRWGELRQWYFRCNHPARRNCCRPQNKYFCRHQLASAQQ